ncbi:transcriptional regulator, ArsR family [Quadrisphaera granulorum]|uniref:ArsR family transcriptional regulator n=1 Tax=Quadrisphaera granulorum TaxID=317664 RepID=A0A315ZQZ2_9ACTN|nr:metalloregulator ArsR/SmtB family transcription factor [Quadrisphaera granulorum]PWJ47719.1 ArsR family transcriptional regulator [Quadrisphaera granulorum]SZE98673.1 transcriptional regulator, ArsR family [Quadrisphaera granulorum]
MSDPAPERQEPSVRGLADLDELDALFAALSHRTRRAILVRLQAYGGAMTSGKIAEGMENTWQTTSRHLRLLQEAGLITAELHGRERIYRLTATPMKDALATWAARFPSDDSNDSNG